MHVTAWLQPSHHPALNPTRKEKTTLKTNQWNRTWKCSFKIWILTLVLGLKSRQIAVGVRLHVNHIKVDTCQQTLCANHILLLPHPTPVHVQPWGISQREDSSSRLCFDWQTQKHSRHSTLLFLQTPRDQILVTATKRLCPITRRVQPRRLGETGKRNLDYWDFSSGFTIMPSVMKGVAPACVQHPILCGF